MKRPLSEIEGLRLYEEGRKLWNEFDPIGVSDAVDDEYDSYVGPSLRILMAGQGEEELTAYIDQVVHEQIGLNRTDAGKDANRTFARKFIDWYRSNPGDTVVQRKD